MTTALGGHDVRVVRDVPHLGGTFYDLVHERTGARHVHLAVPDSNNYFCVLYRTPPPDSTGVPHIMEHCVSGGSRRFPPGAGGDMYNRSLLTDINGMTQADNTTYYFSTRNPTDYLNWLEYVVDVSLFPRLEEDTFLKHRGHFELDPSGRLRFVGTVFNEMKAVFGSPAHHELAAMRKVLFAPDHPYASYAAGDPADMPSLTYEQLRNFNHAHYHPGNAVFISRGDVPLERILAATEEIVGDGFEQRGPSEIPAVAPLQSPVRTEAPVPAGDEALAGTTLAWIAAPSIDPYTRLLLDLANDVVLSRIDGVGPVTSRVAPLRRVMVWLSLATDAGDVEQRVLDAMDRPIDEGGFADALARIELKRREQADALGNYLDAVLPAVLYDGDTAAALDLDALVTRANAGDLRETIRTQLLGNDHRACIALRPDPGLEDRVRETEERWLADLEAKLTDDDRTKIVAETERLVTPVSFEFPRRGLTPAEGRTELVAPEPAAHEGSVTFYEAPTGGVTYLRVRIDLPDAPAPGLRLYIDRIAKRLRGVTANIHSRVDASGERAVHWIEVGARALDRDRTTLPEIVAELRDVEADDETRAATIAAMERSIMPEAQVHLRRLAASSLRRSALADEQLRGFSQLAYLREGGSVAAPSLTQATVSACVIGERDGLVRAIADELPRIPGDAPRATEPDVIDGPRPHRARVTQLPVAFTCEAFRIPGLAHPDVPALAVLTQRIWAGYLNTEIRRGGAYGVDFGVLPGRGLLWISSRRDPLPRNSYDAIRDVIERVVDGRFDGPSADDAKLAILRTTDPADSPAAAARRAWNATFTGQTADLWNEYRRRVLDVTDDDTVRVAKTYLQDGSRATLAGRALLETTGPYDEIEEL